MKELTSEPKAWEQTPRMPRRRALTWGIAASSVSTAMIPMAETLLGEPLGMGPTIPRTPEEALSQLYEGNRRFVEGRPLAVHRDMGRVKEVAPRQTPFAAFLGCADSRVPIEIVFDQGFGDLFVTRIAGNVASSENIGSLEFGTLLLGAKVLYVLGHTSCGAVTATVKGEEVPGQISGLFQHMRPAAKIARGDVEKAIYENVRIQAQVLAESSPVIARMVREQRLLVAGGVYDLDSGRVAPVDVGV